MYTTEDIFQLIMQVEERAAAFYSDLIEREKIERSLMTLCLVLAAEERRHIRVYGELKATFSHQSVPVDLYHRVSQLLARFQPVMQGPPRAIEELLAFAIDLERENLALVIRLRDLLREHPDQELLMIMLDGIVEEEEHHVDQLADVLKRKGDARA